jgi:hypothetical protein
MTVKELILRLHAFNQDLRVVTRGFDEGGLDDINTIAIVTVRFDANLSNIHYGAHEEVDEDQSGSIALLIDF